jgi:hypothetical protein
LEESKAPSPFREDQMRRLLKLSAMAACLTVVAAVANAEVTATANRPKYDGPKAGNDRLDNCWMLAKNCGQEAADKYCQINGYQRAKRFDTEPASPTQTLVGQRCTGSNCRAFKFITCTTNAKKPGSGEAWPQIID